MGGLSGNAAVDVVIQGEVYNCANCGRITAHEVTVVRCQVCSRTTGTETTTAPRLISTAGRSVIPVEPGSVWAAHMRFLRGLAVLDCSQNVPIIHTLAICPDDCDLRDALARTGWTAGPRSWHARSWGHLVEVRPDGP